MRTAIEASTFCASIYKGIRSSRNESNLQTEEERHYKVYLDLTKPWMLEFGQHTNVVDLPSQSNQQTSQRNRSLLPQEKKVFKLNILFASTVITHMSREGFDSWSLFADVAHANESIEHESSVNKLYLFIHTDQVVIHALITVMGNRQHLMLWFAVVCFILFLRAHCAIIFFKCSCFKPTE